MTIVPCLRCSRTYLSTDLTPCPTCHAPICKLCVLPHADEHRPKMQPEKPKHVESKKKHRDEDERGSLTDA